MSDTGNTRTRRGLDMATAGELADLLVELSHDKKYRKEVGKIIREARPDSTHAQAFADIDIEDRFEEFRREQEEKEVKRAQAELLERMNQKRAALLTGGPDGNGRKYAEDDIKKIEELMQRKGLVDYDDGAALYAAMQPPVEPRPEDMPVHAGATWDFPDWAKFGPDPNKASRDTAHQVISEFMRKRH